MNTDTLEGKWTQLRGEAKKQWGRLTDGDLQEAEGRYDRLVGALQERYGMSKQEAGSEVESFLEQAQNQMSDVTSKIQERVQQAQNRLQDRMNKMQDKAEEQAEETAKRVRQTDMDEVTDEYPWLALVGAFLAGILIGIMLSPDNRYR